MFIFRRFNAPPQFIRRLPQTNFNRFILFFFRFLRHVSIFLLFITYIKFVTLIYNLIQNLCLVFSLLSLLDSFFVKILLVDLCAYYQPLSYKCNDKNNILIPINTRSPLSYFSHSMFLQLSLGL